MAVFGSTTEIGLDLIWGGAGSWWEVFIISPRTSLGREQLNYVVSAALQALQLIPGINPAAGAALYAIFAGWMLIASTHGPPSVPVPLESVDADALAGVTITAELYPPGKVWRPPTDRAEQHRLAKLVEYVTQQGDSAHFTVMQQTAGYDVALVVDDQIPMLGKAQAIAQWLAQENGLPYR